MFDELDTITSSRGFLIFLDEQLADSNGYLRALPLISRIANRRIKYVVVWEPGKNCNKPINLTDTNFKFILPSSFVPRNELHCVFVNDEKEEEHSYLSKYIESGVPSIIVVNHQKFIPKQWRTSSKTIEDKTNYIPHSYKIVLNKFLESNGLSTFQLRETNNLAFTETCYIHFILTSERCEKITDLFNFEDKRLALSPIWDWCISLCRLKKENLVANTLAFTFNAFRPSIEANKYVSQVAKKIDSFLQRYHYSQTAIEEIRKKMITDQSSFYSSIKDKIKNKTYLYGILRNNMGVM